jgi:TusA-related sulfurtransferase
VPHFCNEAGHTLLGMEERDAAAIYRVQKA